MFGRTTRVAGSLLILAHYSQTFVLLTANIGDVQKIARKFVPQPLVQNIVNYISQVVGNDRAAAAAADAKESEESGKKEMLQAAEVAGEGPGGTDSDTDTANGKSHTIGPSSSLLQVPQTVLRVPALPAQHFEYGERNTEINRVQKLSRQAGRLHLSAEPQPPEPVKQISSIYIREESPPTANINKLAQSGTNQNVAQIQNVNNSPRQTLPEDQQNHPHKYQEVRAKTEELQKLAQTTNEKLKLVEAHYINAAENGFGQHNNANGHEFLDTQNNEAINKLKEQQDDMKVLLDNLREPYSSQQPIYPRIDLKEHAAAKQQDQQVPNLRVPLAHDQEIQILTTQTLYEEDFPPTRQQLHAPVKRLDEKQIKNEKVTPNYANFRASSNVPEDSRAASAGEPQEMTAATSKKEIEQYDSGKMYATAGKLVLSPERIFNITVSVEYTKPNVNSREE